MQNAGYSFAEAHQILVAAREERALPTSRSKANRYKRVVAALQEIGIEPAEIVYTTQSYGLGAKVPAQKKADTPAPAPQKPVEVPVYTEENRQRLILQNAERLRTLREAIHTTVKRRQNSDKERAAWEQACASYHAHYAALWYPGGDAAWKALPRCEPEAIAIALDFLEADPMFYHSGYTKEALWRSMGHCPLTAAQLRQLEAAALHTLRRRVQREFWIMCRTMARRATPEFWKETQICAETAPYPERTRAQWLAAYRDGIEAGNRVKKEAQALYAKNK